MISARSRDDSKRRVSSNSRVQDATERTKLGSRFVCEDRQSEFYHNGTTGETFDIPRQPDPFTRTREGQKFDVTRRPDPNLSQRLDARDAFAHADMDDTETVALIGDGHTLGKMHAACRKRATLQPISR